MKAQKGYNIHGQRVDTIKLKPTKKNCPFSIWGWGVVVTSFQNRNNMKLYFLTNLISN